MKTCSSCKNNKKLVEFHKNRSRKDGYHHFCKECGHKANITPSRKYTNYKGRAKFKGKEFSLTKEEFMSFWQKPCYYCNSKIETIGLDRIDSSIGYVLNNLVSCCWPCNEAKGRLSQDSFIKIAKVIASRF